MSYHGIITRVDPCRPSFNNPVSNILFTTNDLIKTCVLLHTYAMQKENISTTTYNIEHYKDMYDSDEELIPINVYYFDNNFNCYDINDNNTIIWSPSQAPK